MWVHLSPISHNSKVGPIPVSTTEEGSCPKECPLKDTDCYARFGPLGIHWKQVKEGKRGDNWLAFCNRVSRFFKGQLWRHNQAGDLPQRKDGKIHRTKVMQLSKASQHTNGWTYTHYDPLDSHNARCIKDVNDAGGMTINISADSLEQADQYVALGIAPVVVILPDDAPKLGNKTPGGLPIVVCPAQTTEINCAQCQLCQVKDRKSIVGFYAHGIAHKRLTNKLKGVV